METDTWLSEWLAFYVFSSAVNNLHLHSTSQSLTASQCIPREAVEVVNVVALTKTDKPLFHSLLFLTTNFHLHLYTL